MSGECDECGEHTLECTCNDHMPILSVRQMAISEEIQSQLVSIITDYLDEKPALIDALEWLLKVVVNDQKNGLSLLENLKSNKDSKSNFIMTDNWYLDLGEDD